jgi:hypothetical protein
LSALLAVFIQSCHSQTNNLEPGKDRWTIKNSIPANAKTKQISLQDLIHLPAPLASYSKKLYDKERIPDSVLYKGVYYKEGDIVTTSGYIHLVALEKDDNNRDGDYHIQVLPGSKWADSCLVIEVPYPEFIFSDEALKARIVKARQFVINELLNNHHPNTKATALRPAVHVAITGQLFFDGSHLKGNPRGKQDPDYKIPMKSYNCWEIHPVAELKLLK